MREDSADSNTYSMKALADKELKLWNREQNTIYEAISESLPKTQKESWKHHSSPGLKTGFKSRGSCEEVQRRFSEELEYTASLAESTRERAYELVTEYEEFLTP